MKAKTYHIKILFLFILFSSHLKAQPQFQHIETIDENKGLSSNEINSIVQDQNGFLWIGTQYGLNRYDGDEVKQFFADSSNNSLSDNTIFKILPLDSPYFLLATRKGIDVLDTEDYSFKKLIFPKFSNNPKEQNLNQHIYFLEKDFNGNIWVATPFHIYRFDKNLHLQKQFYSGYSYTDIIKNGKRWVYKILPLRDGSVMIWLDPFTPFLWHIDGEDKLVELKDVKNSNWSFMANQYHKNYQRVGTQYIATFDFAHLTLKITDELNGQTASCILPKEYRGKLESLQGIYLFENGWFAVCFINEGLAWVYLDNNSNTLNLQSDQSIYFPDYSISQIFEDNEHNLFFADRQKGILKIAQQKQKFKTIDLDLISMGKASSYEISSFLKDGTNLWIASYGHGVYRWNEITGELRRFSLKSNSMWSDYIWNFSHHSKDTLWIGTQNGLTWLHKQNGQFGRISQKHPKVLDSVPITTQFVDSKGLIWIGLGKSNGLCVYNPANSKFQLFSFKDGIFPFRYPPSAIVEDRESNIWLSVPTTADLIKWIRKENKFEVVFFPEFQDIDKINQGKMLMDKNNNILWLGIMYAGLVKYDLNTGKIKVFEATQNLNSHRINGINTDKYGNLWLSTNKGLSSFNPKTEKFTNFSALDGLPSTYITSLLLYDSLNNRVFSGGRGKVIYFSPSNSVDIPTLKAKITEIKIRNRTVSLTDKNHLQLQFNDNYLVIHFTGVNLANGEENQYSYRIHDEDDWIPIGNENQVHFANLSPGNYQFSVRVAAKGGEWSDMTDSVFITIEKPFYATVWFYLILCLVVYGIIFAIYRNKLAKIRKVALMRSQISHDLHDEVGSRLTNISMMSQILETKNIRKEQRGQWLGKIKDESERISQNLREIVWNINPDNDSLEEAMPRMLKYAADILEAKGISIHAEILELKNIRLSMEKRRNLMAIFKEVIQNILKHADAQNVFINASVDKKVFHLEITDDGKGFEINERLVTNGIKYMQQRAAQFKWDLRIKSLPKEGTQIVLKIKTT